MGAYIAFDLDALNAAPVVARAAGTTEDVVIGGLSRMWAWCFREGVDSVSAGQLGGFFCAGIREQLVDFGFLAPIEGSELLRVRGAERYLRIKEARKRGGQAAKQHLVPGAVHKKSAKNRVSPRPSPTGSPTGSPSPAEAQPNVSPSPAEGQPKELIGCSSALTPSTEHRTPSLKESDPPKNGEPPPSKKKPKPQREPDPRHRPLQQALEAEFENQRGAPYGFTPADAAHVATLLRMGGSEESLRRWRTALAHQGFPQVSTLGELVKHWNHFAPKRYEAGRPQVDPNQGILSRPEPNACAVHGCSKSANGVVWGKRLCASHHAAWTETEIRSEAEMAAWVRAQTSPATGLSPPPFNEQQYPRGEVAA